MNDRADDQQIEQGYVHHIVITSYSIHYPKLYDCRRMAQVLDAGVEQDPHQHLVAVPLDLHFSLFGHHFAIRLITQSYNFV